MVLRIYTKSTLYECELWCVLLMLNASWLVVLSFHVVHVAAWLLVAEKSHIYIRSIWHKCSCYQGGFKSWETRASYSNLASKLEKTTSWEPGVVVKGQNFAKCRIILLLLWKFLWFGEIYDFFWYNWMSFYCLAMIVL